MLVRRIRKVGLNKASTCGSDLPCGPPVSRRFLRKVRAERTPATGPVQGFCHAGVAFRLLGVCSRVAMRSCCSGVSGGNASTTARTCSASTAAARSWVAGSMSGGVAVGRACSARLWVLVVLSRCFEWFGLSVRYVFLSSGSINGGRGLSDVSRPRRPPPAGRGIREPANRRISWFHLLRRSQFCRLPFVRRLPGCLL